MDVRFVLFLTLWLLGCTSVFLLALFFGGGFTAQFKQIMQVIWLPGCVAAMTASMLTAGMLPPHKE